METSVRQLIANGKFRSALESAKQFHKTHATRASETLLIDAYAARIQSLLDQNLALEAKSLLDLVRERFPSAKDRLDDLQMATAARDNDLAALLSPLNEPELSRERRSVIERVVETHVTDLKALADCPALLPENSLRQAAAALDRAFIAVTTGPVVPEQIALPEVSHRSPLASWKPLIHAIACFHRGDDEAALDHLAAIRSESVPARLAPAMREMLGVTELGLNKLRPTELSLVSRTAVDLTGLRKTLVDLDGAFDEDETPARIFKAVRAAVKECQLRLPEQSAKLKQLITVRAGVEYMDTERLTAALEGAARQDAAFFRMYARAMEGTGEPEDLGEACELWHQFGEQAVREGWFRANSVDTAALYLHMADLLRRLPRFMLLEMQERYAPDRSRSGRPMWDVEDGYFLFPEELYRRACAMDSHPESFKQWMLWAAGRSSQTAEQVALEWNRMRPDDMEPLLHLMKGAEKRNAIPTALSFLAKAERIDALHTSVRSARLRLLAAGAMRHLQQKKPHLAKKKLAEIAILPQSQQGDRPAFLATLRHLTSVADRDAAGIAETRGEVEALLGGRVAADLLIFGVGAASKYLDLASALSVTALDREERKALPASLSRVMAIADDVAIRSFQIPGVYIDETERQFPGACGSLDVDGIRLLGDLGIDSGHPKLAWDASRAGMEKGGPTEAHFLLLRSRAMPHGNALRMAATAAAAVELGRLHRDMEVVGRAVEMVRNPAGGDSLTLTLEDAREVLRAEIASAVYPGRFDPGPDYSRFLPNAPCDCPDCRRKGGAHSRVPEDQGPVSVLDIEGEVERSLRKYIPEGMPPDIAETLIQLLKEGFLAGETPEEVLSKISSKVRGKSPTATSKKRRNK